MDEKHKNIFLTCYLVDVIAVYNADTKNKFKITINNETNDYMKLVTGETIKYDKIDTTNILSVSCEEFNFETFKSYFNEQKEWNFHFSNYNSLASNSNNKLEYDNYSVSYSTIKILQVNKTSTNETHQYNIIKYKEKTIDNTLYLSNTYVNVNVKENTNALETPLGALVLGYNYNDSDLSIMKKILKIDADAIIYNSADEYNINFGYSFYNKLFDLAKGEEPTTNNNSQKSISLKNLNLKNIDNKYLKYILYNIFYNIECFYGREYYNYNRLLKESKESKKSEASDLFEKEITKTQLIDKKKKYDNMIIELNKKYNETENIINKITIHNLHNLLVFYKTYNSLFRTTYKDVMVHQKYIATDIATENNRTTFYVFRSVQLYRNSTNNKTLLDLNINDTFVTPIPESYTTSLCIYQDYTKSLYSAFIVLKLKPTDPYTVISNFFFYHENEIVIPYLTKYKVTKKFFISRPKIPTTIKKDLEDGGEDTGIKYNPTIEHDIEKYLIGHILVIHLEIDDDNIIDDPNKYYPTLTFTDTNDGVAETTFGGGKRKIHTNKKEKLKKRITKKNNKNRFYKKGSNTQKGGRSPLLSLLYNQSLEVINNQALKSLPKSLGYLPETDIANMDLPISSDKKKFAAKGSAKGSVKGSAKTTTNGSAKGSVKGSAKTTTNGSAKGSATESKSYTLDDYFETSEREFNAYQNGEGTCKDTDFSRLNPYWNMY